MGTILAFFSNIYNIIDVDNITQLESKCCPFLNFKVTSEGGYTVIKVTGPPGVKQFIADQFGLMA